MKRRPRTFGDLLNPSVSLDKTQEPVAADSCFVATSLEPITTTTGFYCTSLDHNEDKEEGCSNPNCFKHEPPLPLWKEFTDAFDKQLATLGEEADVARCEDCNKEQQVIQGVCCGACGAFYCRGLCWRNHWCGPLTTYDGSTVQIGDRLRHVDNNPQIYEVVEMAHTFTVGGVCHGVRKDGTKLPIRPRLMLHVEVS